MQVSGLPGQRSCPSGGARAQPVTSHPELHDGVHSAILPTFGFPQQNMVGMCLCYTHSHTCTRMGRKRRARERALCS